MSGVLPVMGESRRVLEKVGEDNEVQAFYCLVPVALARRMAGYHNSECLQNRRPRLLRASNCGKQRFDALLELLPIVQGKHLALGEPLSQRPLVRVVSGVTDFDRRFLYRLGSVQNVDHECFALGVPSCCLSVPRPSSSFTSRLSSAVCLALNGSVVSSSSTVVPVGPPSTGQSRASSTVAPPVNATHASPPNSASTSNPPRRRLLRPFHQAALP